MILKTTSEGAFSYRFYSLPFRLILGLEKTDVNKLIDSQHDKLRSEIISDFVPSQLSLAIEKRNEDLQRAFNDKQKEIESLTTEYKTKHDKLMSLFNDIPGLSTVLSDNVDWAAVQTNIAWVHDYVQNQFINLHKTEHISGTTAILGSMKKLIDAVCGHGSKISGDADDYHNLSSELARNHQYDMAVEVLKKAQPLFKHNIDILAGIVLYSARLGHPDLEAEEQLLKVSRQNWNWRAFTFYVDALKCREVSDENRDAALTIANEYIRCLPDEERAYMAKYEVLKAYGLQKEAKETLEQAEANLGMKAQCSLALCHIYSNEGAFELGRVHTNEIFC